MKIFVKHNKTEILLDDNQNDNSIKYMIPEILNILDKIFNEVKKIENKYLSQDN